MSLLHCNLAPYLDGVSSMAFNQIQFRQGMLIPDFHCGVGSEVKGADSLRGNSISRHA